MTRLRLNFGVFLLILLCSTLLSSVLASTNSNGYKIVGRVKLESGPGVGHQGLKGFLAKTTNVKVVLNGGEAVTFVRADGYFSFFGVSAGTHLLEVVAMGYAFSPVRVDVSARLHGTVQAYQTENFKQLSELVLEPMRDEYYYEKREPFSILALLKSPMGLMVSFMVVAVFLLPKLMENIDPEEMRRAQEEFRNQPTPSVASLLQPRSN